MEYRIRPYEKGEENYVADAHRRIYSEEYHWGKVFTDYAASIPLDFAKREKDDREELWVAEADGRLVGSLMLCRTDEPLTGQMRVFLIEKDYRRRGIGSALIRALMDKARGAGYRQLILWTAREAVDAVRMYERLGFHAVEEKENFDWTPDGSPVTELKMVLTL